MAESVTGGQWECSCMKCWLVSKKYEYFQIKMFLQLVLTVDSTVAHCFCVVF